MGKGLWLVILAFIAASAWATDPWFWQGYYDWTTNAPHNITDKEVLKNWLAAANSMSSSQREDARYDNGTYFNPSVEGGTNYAWMYASLRVDHNSHKHLGKWEGFTDSYEDHPMYCYIWNPAEERFDLADAGPTGIWTTARTFPISADYLEWDSGEGYYIIRILIEGYTESGYRHMNIDCAQALCP